MSQERVRSTPRVGAKVVGFDHVSVTTRDLEASLRFYRDLLGIPVLDRGRSRDEELSQVMGLEGVEIEWADLELGAGRVLELIAFVHPAGSPVVRTLWDPGATHIGLRVQDADAIHDRLLEAGVRVIARPVRLTEEGSWHGVRVLYAIDPDGTWIELVQRPEDVTVVLGDDGDVRIELADPG